MRWTGFVLGMVAACGGGSSGTPDGGGPDAPVTLPDAGPPADFSEQEQNGELDLANAIPAPTAARGTLIRGESNRVNVLGRRVIDRDYFTFDAASAGGLEVLVQPAGASTMVPSVTVMVGSLVFRNDNAARGDARVQAYVPQAGQKVIILVDDARAEELKLPPGSADDDYTALVELRVVPVQPLGAGAIDSPGKLAIYSFDAAAAMDAWIDLDVTGGRSLSPRLQVFRADGRVLGKSQADKPRFAVPALALPPGAYFLAVSDYTGFSSSDASGFTARLVAGRTPTIADAAGHGTSGTALAATAELTVIPYELPAGGQLWIRLEAGLAGAGGRVSTTPATAATGTSDTRLTLYQEDGTTEIVSVDDPSEGDPFAALTFDTSEARYLKVSGGQPASTGSILVFVERNACISSAAAGDPVLSINEVYPRNEPAVDHNGDGTASVGQDRFVELQNGTRSEVAADGMLLRTAAGLRYRFACTDTVLSREAAVVFGGCTGASCATDRRLANASPANPYAADADGLGLGAGAGEVMLLAPGGELIDRFAFAASVDNKPFVRRSGTRCDIRTGPPTTECSLGGTPAEGADSNIFPAPNPAVPETCGAAPTLVSGQTLFFETLANLTDDYDLSSATGACARRPGLTSYAGGDAAYKVSLLAGARLTVTVDAYPTFLAERYNPAIFLVTDCASAASCVALGDATSYGTETASYRNMTAGTQTVFIVIDDENPSAVEYQLRILVD